MSDDEDVDKTQSDHDDSTSDASDYPFSFYKNDQCDCYDAKTRQDKLEELRSLREKIDWEVEDERRKLLNQLYHAIIHWNERLPDLRDVFRREEIDWLLTEDARNDAEPYQFYGKLPFVNFAVRSGYKDEPDPNENGGNGGKAAALRRATALHYAGRKGPVNRFIVAALFDIYDRFDVNYVDELDGLTHFHVACELNLLPVVEKFLELGQDPDCRLAREASSSVDPPLHLALRHKHEKMVALLLRHGADPNLGNKDGLTALHVVCRSGSDDDDFLETFFDTNDANQQRLRIDAKDKLGRTPLQWAVARFMPNAVERFLDRGADLSGFVYPDEALYDDYVRSFLWHPHKLQLACTALDILESLETRGYELDRDGASTIMKLFSKLELLIDPVVDLDDSLRRDDDFRRRAKRWRISPRLTLHDSLLWRPEVAAKLLDARDCCRFENSPEFWKHRKQLRDTYAAHLFEIMSRRFFRRWGLEFVLTLTRYRLPILCCEMIVERMRNRDLFNVCLVATGQCTWNEKQA